MCMMIYIRTHGATMRTNVEIDDQLMRDAMDALKLDTKKAVIDAALRQVVDNARRRRALKELEGMGWEGDLDAMREGRG